MFGRLFTILLFCTKITALQLSHSYSLLVWSGFWFDTFYTKNLCILCSLPHILCPLPQLLEFWLVISETSLIFFFQLMIYFVSFCLAHWIQPPILKLPIPNRSGCRADLTCSLGKVWLYPIIVLIVFCFSNILLWRKHQSFSNCHFL